jgi:hypothetical protein
VALSSREQAKTSQAFGPIVRYRIPRPARNRLEFGDACRVQVVTPVLRTASTDPQAEPDIAIDVVVGDARMALAHG